MNDKIRDEQAQASLDSERLRQIAEWLSMELGHEETAKRVAQIADRHDTLAAGFHRTVEVEPSNAAVKAAWDALHGKVTQHQLAVALRAAAAVQGDAKLPGNSVQGEPSQDREAQGMSEAEMYVEHTVPSQRAEVIDDFMTGWRTADRTRVQGEPSDAQIVVAVDAFMASQLESEDGPTLVHKNMAAALRAAAIIQERETR